MATHHKGIYATIAGSSSFQCLCKRSHLLFWTSISVLLAAQFQRFQMRSRSQVLVHGCLGCRATPPNQLSRQNLKRLVYFQGRFRKDDFLLQTRHPRHSETSSASEGSTHVVTGRPHRYATHRSRNMCCNAHRAHFGLHQTGSTAMR